MALSMQQQGYICSSVIDDPLSNFAEDTDTSTPGTHSQSLARGLFDDEDVSEENDLFQVSASGTHSRVLFHDLDEEDDLFPLMVGVRTRSNSGLFGGADVPDDLIFLTTVAKPSPSSNRHMYLFGEDSDDKLFSDEAIYPTFSKTVTVARLSPSSNKDLFGEYSDDNLFAVKPIPPTSSKTVTVASLSPTSNKDLFGEDSDDDLFTVKPIPPTSSKTVTVASLSPTSNKDLFGEDLEDDLFSNKAVKPIPPTFSKIGSCVHSEAEELGDDDNDELFTSQNRAATFTSSSKTEPPFPHMSSPKLTVASSDHKTDPMQLQSRGLFEEESDDLFSYSYSRSVNSTKHTSSKTHLQLHTKIEPFICSKTGLQQSESPLLEVSDKDLQTFSFKMGTQVPPGALHLKLSEYKYPLSNISPSQATVQPFVPSQSAALSKAVHLAPSASTTSQSDNLIHALVPTTQTTSSAAISTTEGPKLPHLTAQHPLASPPERYTVFHKDDSKEAVATSSKNTDCRGITRGRCLICFCNSYFVGARGMKCKQCTHPPGKHQNLSIHIKSNPRPSVSARAMSYPKCAFPGCDEEAYFDLNSLTQYHHCPLHLLSLPTHLQSPHLLSTNENEYQKEATNTIQLPASSHQTVASHLPQFAGSQLTQEQPRPKNSYSIQEPTAKHPTHAQPLDIPQKSSTHPKSLLSMQAENSTQKQSIHIKNSSYSTQEQSIKMMNSTQEQSMQPKNAAYLTHKKNAHQTSTSYLAQEQPRKEQPIHPMNVSYSTQRQSVQQKHLQAAYQKTAHKTKKQRASVGDNQSTHRYKSADQQSMATGTSRTLESHVWSAAEETYHQAPQPKKSNQRSPHSQIQSEHSSVSAQYTQGTAHSKETQCALPDCNRLKYQDPANGRVHDFCGRSHACEAQRRGIALHTTILSEIDDSEFLNVCTIFEQTWAPEKGNCPTVLDVFAVVNTQLEQRWQAYKQTHSDGQSHEWYFHGSILLCDIARNGVMCSNKDCGICGICSMGFDQRCIRKNIKFQRFGHGFYLAPNSSKCHDYTQTAHLDYRVMLLCPVVPGKKYVLQSNVINLKGPPKGCDCIYGMSGPASCLNYDEIVLYNPDAILPQYVIMYQ